MKSEIWIFTIIMIMVYIPLLFMQAFSQRAVFYGVRIPLGFENKEELKKEDKIYKRNLNICFLITTVLSVLLMNMISEEYVPVIFTLVVFIFIFESTLCFYITNKRVKAIKKRENWGEFLTKENLVIVDIKAKNRNYEKLSNWYFAPPITMFLWVVFGTLRNLKNADYVTLTIFPFTIGLMFVCFLSINKSKQNLNGGNVLNIRFQNIKFRRTSGIFIILITYTLSLMFTVMNLSNMGLITVKLENTIMGTSVIFTMILSVIVMVYSYKVGQGGKNIPLDENANRDEKLIVNREDDDHYIWGMFYYNPEDPALFVEKRAGVGWTLNVARPMGKVAMVLTTVLIVASLGMVVYTSASMKLNLQVNQHTLSIKGMYSENINKEDIEELTFEDSLPEISMKQNGGAIGNKKIGYFKTKNGEKVKLFIENDDSPVIKIVTKDRIIYMNYEDREKTEELFNELKR